MKSAQITVEVLKNVINEELATFRISLNKDINQRFEQFEEKMESKFATKEDLENLATKRYLDEMEARQNQYLSAAVGDIVDTIDETNKQHLVKYHHVSL